MRSGKTAQRAGQSGFTLIEIMVVVTIIAVIAAMVAPNIFGNLSGAQIKVAKTEITRLEEALGIYKLDNFNLPSTEQGLEALVRKPGGSPEPTAQWRQQLKKLPVDPWGNPYQYLNPGSRGDTDIFSYGPDGTKSEDDIGNW